MTDLKKILAAAARFLILCAVYTAAFIIPTLVFPLSPALTAAAAGQTGNPGLAILINAVLMSVLILVLFHNPRVRGVPLVLLALISLWGLQTFMTQIETWYFREAFPLITGEEFPFFFLRNLLTLGIFLPAAAWVCGCLKHGSVIEQKAVMPGFKRIAAVLPVLGVLYIILYFVFGYYVAWQVGKVRFFYSGSLEMKGFIEQWLFTMNMHNWIVPFQWLRGMMWGALSLPLMMILGSERKRAMLLFPVFFGLIPVIQLFFPNPVMPEAVRMAHFVEVGFSTGVFGFLAAVLLTGKKA